MYIYLCILTNYVIIYISALRNYFGIDEYQITIYSRKNINKLFVTGIKVVLL